MLIGGRHYRNDNLSLGEYVIVMLVLVSVFASVVLGIMFVKPRIFNNIDCVVKKDGVVLYQGKGFTVDVSTAGNQTKVTLKDSWIGRINTKQIVDYGITVDCH